MKLLILSCVIALHCSISTKIIAEEQSLSVQDEGTIRRIVYGGKARSIPADEIGFSMKIDVPAQLSDFYAKQPDAVLVVLLEIMAGGNPTDSVSAAAYAVSLLKNPEVGDVCNRMFDAERYDIFDTDWACTPRQHWIKVCKNLQKKPAM